MARPIFGPPKLVPGLNIRELHGGNYEEEYTGETLRGNTIEKHEKETRRENEDGTQSDSFPCGFLYRCRLCHGAGEPKLAWPSSGPQKVAPALTKGKYVGIYSRET